MPAKLLSRLAYAARIGWRPAHIGIIARHVTKGVEKSASDEKHLEAVVSWLIRAHDAGGGGGVSGGYFFNRGWEAPYPETTGYIIPTFLKIASSSGDASCLERAVSMGDWEVDVQLPNGAVRGGKGINEYPIVFNTGQVVLGWTALYRATGEKRFLESAIRAGDWLVSTQDDDGKWSRSSYLGVPHAYHTRVAWSLCELFKLARDRKYKNAAAANIRWALGLANDNGWISQMSFAENCSPLTHTIAYTLRGLLECSLMFDEEMRSRITALVSKAGKAMIDRYDLSRAFLPATLDSRWQSKDKSTCLTGNAQLAIIWFKMHAITGDDIYRKNAIYLIDRLKKTQFLDHPHPGIRGGIAGSYPIWGRYAMFAYPNWAAKFFADSIMIKMGKIAP